MSARVWVKFAATGQEVDWACAEAPEWREGGRVLAFRTSSGKDVLVSLGDNDSVVVETS